MTCTVKVGRPVLLVMTSADCGSAEDRPFYGKTAAEQRACVLEFINGLDITSITVSMPGKATFVAAGWIAEIRGMRRGQHDVRAALNIVLDGQPASFPFIVHFNVVGGNQHDDDD